MENFWVGKPGPAWEFAASASNATTLTFSEHKTMINDVAIRFLPGTRKNGCRPMTNQMPAMRIHFDIPILILVAAVLLCPRLVQATGLNWPASHLLPTFSVPASTLDCIDISSASSAEIDLFASLEGIVNRTQPQIACVTSMDGEGKFTWLNLHNLSYNLTNGYGAILKYR